MHIPLCLPPILFSSRMHFNLETCYKKLERKLHFFSYELKVVQKMIKMQQKKPALPLRVRPIVLRVPLPVVQPRSAECMFTADCSTRSKLTESANTMTLSNLLGLIQLKIELMENCIRRHNEQDFVSNFWRVL